MKWYRSIAVKSFVIAFLATHIPLLTLIAVVTLRPQWLTAWGVLLSTLAATLIASGFVIWTLWRLFRPLRQAADGLVGFMTHGKPVAMSLGSQDEIGRLVQLLVQSLAHMDRSRAPLLRSGSAAIDRRAQHAHDQGQGDLATMALLEVDQWRALDESADLRRMQEVQEAMDRRLQELMTDGEMLLPWGRGRFLLVMNGTAGQVRERLCASCQRFHVASGPTPYTCSVAVEPRAGGTTGWTSALQRLDQQLFALRLQGDAAKTN